MSEQANVSRRTILSGAAAGFVLTASGLFLPESGEEAAAREGALGGAMGGRHGKNHRGRDKHKRRDNNKKDRDKKKDHGNDRPPQGAIFRDVALYVHNMRNVPVQVQGWQLHFTGPNPGGDWYFRNDSWDWSTIEAKPTTGMEHFKDFVGSEWAVVVRIGTDRVVGAGNDMLTYPGGWIKSGGWDAKHGWNPLGDTLAQDDKMRIDDSIMAGGIRLQRTIDSATHIQFYVWLT